MQNIGFILFLGLAFLSGPLYGAIPHPCAAGNLPVGTFKLLLLPPKGGSSLSVDSVNLVQAGDKLKFEPVDLPSSIRDSARIALVLVPAQKNQGKHQVEVLDAQPAADPAVWSVPMRSSVVGVIFGPHGLDTKKFSHLMKRDPELIPELATYAEQSSTVNALVSTLSQYEQSEPGSEDLNAVLTGFSTRYGVAFPQLAAGAPAGQQASQLLQAVIPTLSKYDPLASSRSVVMQQSAGLAASVASLFYGTPIGLAVGGAALVQSLRTVVSPNTDFRAAYIQSKDPGVLELCSQNTPPKPRMRTAYLWMLRIPDAEIPTVSLPENARVLIGSSPTLKVTCATNSQLRALPRARQWRLVSSSHQATVPVKVTVGNKDDTLSVDLSQTTLPSGSYHFEGLWDWSWFRLNGILHVRSFSDFSTVSLTPKSQDQMVEGNGLTKVKLTGADFEFVQKVAIESLHGTDGKPLEFSFTAPKAQNTGVQESMEVEINTSALRPGPYKLLLTQSNGNTQPVPAVIHPPYPKIQDLPLRANLDEPHQVLILHGTGLERIDQIISEGVIWTLPPLRGDNKDVTERQAIIKLMPGRKKGEILNARMTVDGIHDPVEIADFIQVTGPRPRILDVDESFPQGGSVALMGKEIPAGSAMSFAIHVANVDAHPSLKLACTSSGDDEKALDLQPGEQRGSTQLDFAGENVLFLSLDPGSVGQSGCELSASVTAADVGASDPYTLGRVIRLPQIDKFSLSDEKVAKSLYSGFLTGQNLQMIAKTGWNEKTGYPVDGIPTPVPGNPQEQTLKIQLAWPPPSPDAPVYIWLRGENQGRKTTANY